MIKALEKTKAVRFLTKTTMTIILTTLISGILSFSCIPNLSTLMSPAKPFNPPISVTLDRLGVIKDHDVGSGDIYLYIAVSDGKGQPQVQRIPSSGEIYLNDNESKEIDQQIFSSDSVGDQIRIVAVAFESDSTICQVKSMAMSVLNALAPYLQGNVGTATTMINTLLKSQPSSEDGCPDGVTPETPCDDFVGAIEKTWTSAERWGVGSYNDVRSGDLRLWFTISIPGGAQVNQPISPVTPAPKPQSTSSIPTPSSTPIPQPAPTPPKSLTVNFDGWYVGGIIITTTAKGKSVTAKMSLSGGNPGQYKVRVRRAISAGADQTVAEHTFAYNGISTFQEVSFVPQYATAEAYTQGYHADLSKDGIVLWTLTNAYPPRLKVSK